ncbi:phage tail terminator protein [Pseudomonas aeruginosa]|uniref:phage tail terminator protein n=1 Tax=Pseudomonas aeruginosa TaxID=287 RepID=UPI003AAA8C80
MPTPFKSVRNATISGAPGDHCRAVRLPVPGDAPGRAHPRSTAFQHSGIPDLATLDEQRQGSPCVYVVYLGDEISTRQSHQGGSRAVQTVTQHWAAVLTLYYADAQGDGGAAGAKPARCSASCSRH